MESISSSSPRLLCLSLFLSLSLFSVCEPNSAEFKARCRGEVVHLMFAHPIKKCCEVPTSVEAAGFSGASTARPEGGAAASAGAAPLADARVHRRSAAAAGSPGGLEREQGSGSRGVVSVSC